MKRLQRAVVITILVESLESHGSWCGGTHIQKAVYFLQELVGVPLGYEFTLYRYGPYSFDLNDELSAIRGDEFLEFFVRDPDYAPSYRTGKVSSQLKERFPKTIRRRKQHIDFVAEALGNRGIGGLERLATALFVTLEDPSLGDEEAAAKLNKYKPHVDLASARAAVKEVKEIRGSAEALSCKDAR
ncbi:MAG: hypothetical protein N2C14_31425 [Planctomycetales bacterium]